MADKYLETLMKCIFEIKYELENIKEDIVKINDSINDIKKENESIKNNASAVTTTKKKKWFLF